MSRVLSQQDSGASSSNFAYPNSSSRSQLPRPNLSGKSDSSASSTSNQNDFNESSDEDDNLLAKCISSGMPKSKSEPVDLKKRECNFLEIL